MTTRPPDAPDATRRRRLPRVPGVLRDEPVFRRLFLSQVLSVLGDRVTAVALPFAVLAVGGGVAEVAAVSAAQFLPFVVLALPAGVWADRWERRTILIASDTARLVTQATAAVLLLSGHARVVELVVFAALYGAADAFFAPAFAGLLPRTVSAENLQSANALRGLTFSTSNVAGPAAAGLLIAFAGGPGAALVFDTATFAVSVALLRSVPRSRAADLEDSGAPPDPFLRSLRQGWVEVRSRSWVAAYLGGLTAYHALVLPAIFVLGPVLMEQDYDGARSWALVTALFGIGNILGDLLLLRWRPRHALGVGAWMMLVCCSQAVIIGSGLPVLGIGVLELLTGVCVTGTFTLWETSLGEHIPSGALSRVASYDYLATAGAIPVGNFAMGLVAASLGTRETLTGMSVAGALVTLTMIAVPAVRRLPRGPAHEGSTSVST